MKHLEVKRRQPVFMQKKLVNVFLSETNNQRMQEYTGVRFQHGFIVDLCKLDVHCRKRLRRSIVPPSGMNWMEYPPLSMLGIFVLTLFFLTLLLLHASQKLFDAG